MVDFTESVRSLASETGFSGVVRIDDCGGAALIEAFGLTHRGFGTPNTADTQFGIASGGKGFTALAVVSLIADGVLSLDTTARSILGSDLGHIADDVTVGHLLAHRSGIGDYLDEDKEGFDPYDYVLVSPVQDLLSTDGFIVEVDGQQTKFIAGERFSYCNGGYIILALIAERSSGMDYDKLVAERVLQPAGLRDTGFLRADEPSGRMAMGYLHAEGLRTNVFHLPIRGNGDGGVYTTAADMHRFWRALFDGQIVPSGWVAEMTRPHSEAPDQDSRYGLGFWLAKTGSTVMLLGGDPGVSFFSTHDPTSGCTVTILSNTTGGAWPLVRYVEDFLRA